jgi:hypothetical protein
MKRLLIATAALALVGAGAAVAQDAKTSPTGVGSPASTAGLAPPPITGTPQATPDATANPTMPTPGTGTLVGDMAASNPPPAAGSYPPCRRKGQDRCVVTAQLKHHMTTASLRHRTAKTHTGA